MIEKIHIKNFKLFNDEEFVFNPQFNLIVGENGSGKSSILKAIAIAMAGWTHAYKKDKSNLRPIDDSEIREIESDGRFDKAKSTSIEAFGQFPIVDQNLESKKGSVRWKRERKEGDDHTDLKGVIQYFLPEYNCYHSKKYNLNLSTLGDDVLRYIEKGGKFDLPVFAFYECDRLWVSNEKINIEESIKRRFGRFDPYLDCFHTGTDSKAIEAWLLKLELSYLQDKSRGLVKEAIETIAKNALEGCVGLRFDINESRVMVQLDSGASVPFEHLSDGQRTILSLYFDIAYRAIILNPHLDVDAILKVKGIVLIDELDLHLHPNWQRTITHGLRNTFPNIQFICTTHSPFIMQSIEDSGELIMMNGEPLSSYLNRSVEDISVNMGVERPDVAVHYIDAKESAKSFLEDLQTADLTSEEKLEEFKERLADTVQPYADNPAFQAFLELQLASKTELAK